MMKKLIAALCLLAAMAHAEPHTFTDQFGRTIIAELVSLEDNAVRIRRDDGQIFTLPVSKLSDADQKFIKDWDAAQPSSARKPDTKFSPDPKKLVVNLSRGKFSSQTLSQFEGYTHKHENWGYSIQLINQHLRGLDKVRVEYNLFARTYSDTTSPTMITGAKEFSALASTKSEVFRTGSAEVCKQRDVYFGNSGGEMRGIWLRIYVDGELLIEQSSPDSLMKNEKWTKVVVEK